MKSILSYIVIFIVIYFILVGLVYFFQEKLLFFPVKLTEHNPFLKELMPFEIILENSEVKLHGWLLNPGKNKILIYFGGNAEEVSSSADDFGRFSDYSILLINYRGYGKSEGSPSEKVLFGDALFVYDSVIKNASKRYEKIVIIGRSLGSSVAVYLAANRKTDGLILVTPFDSVLNVAKRIYSFLPVSLLLKHPFNSLNYVADIKLKTLILIAENDGIIPYKNSLNLAQKMADKAQTVIISNSDHNDIQLYPQYWQAIDNYLLNIGSDQSGK